jgi:hypothetical protein
LFEIKEFDMPVTEVDTIFGKVSSVKLSYLRLKDKDKNGKDLNIKPTDLLSELYYRNIAGRSYPDWDNNKILPCEITITH